MKVIIVSGSVGTGKSITAKRLAKQLDFVYIDVNRVVYSYKLSEGYDKLRKCKIIDVKRLNKVLIKVINKCKSIERANKNQYDKVLINKKNNGIIIDSHLSHYLPRRYVDLCIVTKCNLKLLKKRLEGRGYSKNKVRENIECEIFDICYNEALERGHNVIVINTTKNINIGSLARRIKWHLTRKPRN